MTAHHAHLDYSTHVRRRKQGDNILEVIATIVRISSEATKAPPSVALLGFLLIKGLARHRTSKRFADDVRNSNCPARFYGSYCRAMPSPTSHVGPCSGTAVTTRSDVVAT